jgi:hypothetical protein
MGRSPIFDPPIENAAGSAPQSLIYTRWAETQIEKLLLEVSINITTRNNI